MSTQFPPWSEPPPPAPGLGAQGMRLPSGRENANGLPARPDLDGPRATWRWWMAILVYLGAGFVGIVVATPAALLEPESTALMAVNIVFALVQLGGLLFWLTRAHPGWTAAMGFLPRERALREIGVGLGLGVLVLLFVTFAVGTVLSVLFSLFAGENVVPPQQLPDELDATGRTLAVVYAVAIAPVAEEFFFRGCLYRSLRDRYGRWVGSFGSAFAFGLVHYVPGAFIDSLLLMVIMVFTGLGFALIYERRGNLVAPIAGHVAFNVIGIWAILTATG
jgi:membrane protease YdiL (CAAX protease family)